MAVENFKPIVWSTSIFMSYDEAMVFRPLMNTQYEGDIKESGDKVKITEIGDMEATEYDGSAITYGDVDDAAKFLDIDQQYYIAKKLENIDKAQANVNLMGEITRKMGVGMARNIDQFCAGLVADAGIVAGTEDSPVSITSANVTEYLASVNTAMDESNCPETGRVAVVPAWMKEKINLAQIDKDTDNSRALSTGYVGTYLGMDIYMSNNIEKSGTTWYKPMFFIRNESIAFAEQLVEVKAHDLEDYFGDGLKMLTVYGGKVTRPSSLKTLICAPGSEV